MFPPLRFSQDSNIKSCILCESTKLQTLVHMTSAHECVHCLILNYKPAPYTQMQLLGMISNSMNGFTSPEDLFPASGEAMSEYELLYCFRRDSDKVQNYLKILKCRIVPDHGCWVPLTCTAGPHIILSVIFHYLCPGLLPTYVNLFSKLSFVNNGEDWQRSW